MSGILETKQISHLHGPTLFTIPLGDKESNFINLVNMMI